ncbi:hypothetical protein COCOR_03173 [Corallococcus coralloides DSM 2259]|uniref:Uncharacterized protein n=1 Tax=Corallococcus coralloides (strain ATCC 25202 / DSM 2259 / NBRC 100086 / M2) TaxID=1144275 RepID=H8MF69_CORCM|nr:hypothetical protein [Corallococcus coralloides]AFE05056.1 hypothetical protein COCOR_03173 [Corallococcus coralloides DSM 2259]
MANVKPGRADTLRGYGQRLAESLKAEPHFTRSGINTAFENLEGFPMDWKTNTQAFIQFLRDHQCNSFLEYGEYPYFSSDEIKKALKLKAAFTEMLEQMQ